MLSVIHPVVMKAAGLQARGRTDGHSLIGARGKQPLFKGVLKARPKVCNAVQCRGIQPNKKQGMKTPVC